MGLHSTRGGEGDGNMLLRKIRKGAFNLAPPPLDRGRVRLQLWKLLLRSSARRKLVQFGTLANLAYTLAARVPSELLQQCRWNKLMIGPTQLQYKDVRRKGKSVPSTLTRWCVCQKDELLCWHSWLAAWQELQGESAGSSNLVFSLSPQQVNSILQDLLRSLGMPPEEAKRHTSHAFRRGAGVDTLEAEDITCTSLGGNGWRKSGAFGVRGMLNMGEWAHKASASHYASYDEMAASSIAFAIAEASDDES